MEASTDPATPCPIHELRFCALCHPPARSYRTGLRAVDVPSGSYVQVKGGRSVYHQPDCYNVTGDWDGADQAQLGGLLIRSPDDIQRNDLRPAQCCQPPDLPRH